jgi:2-polyprenyl-3-methyl-5-hydroxy-6-metoxy-1,4-benzoquinol methylase
MTYNTTDVFYFYEPDFITHLGPQEFILQGYFKQVPWFPDGFQYKVSKDLDFVLKQWWKGIFLAYEPWMDPDITYDLLDKFDLILFHDHQWDQDNKNEEWYDNIPNYRKVWARSFINTGPHNPYDKIYYSYWAQTTLDNSFPEKHYPSIADYDPGSVKQYKFDILLGQPRAHRDWLFQKLKQNDLLNNNIVTYRYVKESSGRYEYIRHENYTSPAYDPELDPSYNIQGLSTANNIPWKIYGHTDFSVVAETNYKNDTKNYIITEKTYKPILAKRLFVLFAPAGQLKMLKDQGFQTFGDIIDESYDDILSDELRYQKAFDQLLLLNRLDSAEVKRLIIERCEYNYNLLLDKLTDQKNTIVQAVEKYLPRADSKIEASRKIKSTILSQHNFTILQNLKVLEIGCHGGYFTREILKYTPDLTGIDLDPECINYCQTRFPDANILKADMHEFVKISEYYDAVVVYGVLYHTHSPLQLLEDIANFIQPKYMLLETLFDTTEDNIWHIQVGEENINQPGMLFVENKKACKIALSISHALLEKTMGNLGYKKISKININDIPGFNEINPADNYKKGDWTYSNWQKLEVGETPETSINEELKIHVTIEPEPEIEPESEESKPITVLPTDLLSRKQLHKQWKNSRG